MQHKCKITVLRKECYTDLQDEYLADPKSGPCRMIACCNDGTRPVIFKIERIEED